MAPTELKKNKKVKVDWDNACVDNPFNVRVFLIFIRSKAIEKKEECKAKCANN